MGGAIKEEENRDSRLRIVHYRQAREGGRDKVRKKKMWGFCKLGIW